MIYMVEKEEFIKMVMEKLKLLGLKGITIENAGYLRRDDIETLYKTKLQDYANPLYFKDERLELKRAYKFFMNLFNGPKPIGELGEAFGEEYRTNLDLALLDTIQTGHREAKKALEYATEIDAEQYNKKMKKIEADKYVAAHNYYTKKRELDEELKEAKIKEKNIKRKERRNRKKAKKKNILSFLKFW